MAEFVIKEQQTFQGDEKDIRQLSGYARDRKILENHLDTLNDNEVVGCIIIFPKANSYTDFKNRKLQETPITEFTKFWKCSIELPLKLK